MRAHWWLPNKVEAASWTSPHFEKRILEQESQSCRGGSRGVRWAVFAPPCVSAKNLILFNPIRVLSCRSLDLVDVLLIGKGKNETTKVLKSNSKIPHFWGLNCHLCLRVEQGAVRNRNRKSQKTWVIWKQSPKVTCQTPGAKHRQWNNLIAEGTSKTWVS